MEGQTGVAVNPAKFLRDVRVEVARVTWPGRKETAVTTALVLGMTVLTAAFFFGVDQVIGLAVRALFGAAG
ncbi:MAG: preprotein translocase subunit SecE [Rhodospirillales bacterium]|jgi:preprotein translocase subunit SecE|nr:preprotein translocase subunit SecE [Rhodospirillales bacterium]